MQATTDLKRYETPYDYAADRDKLKRFMLFFRKNGEYKYLSQLRSLGEAVNIDLDDLKAYDQSGLAARMAANAWSYTQQLSKVVDELLYSEDVVEASVDVFYSQRISRFKEKYPDKNILDHFPSCILRNYAVNIRPAVVSARRDVLAIREVGAGDIGRLINVRGIVTRVSVVKPAMRVATYICESCGSETYQQVNNDVFDMLEECGSEKCRTRNVRGTLTLLTRGSRFMRKQTVMLQEQTGDVPHGSIPRMMKVEMNGSLTGGVSPGEVAVISGIFLPRPYYGYRRLKAGLLNDTYLQCTAINRNRDEMSKEEAEGEVLEGADAGNVSGEAGTSDAAGVASNPSGVSFNNNSFVISSYVIPSINIMSILVDSFAPEIYGMRNVKKILLLMLAGAPTLERPDGMKIRGDINCLILGDPGIAKSQLLKTMVRISRRGVYTTGRGSSGVGLTAAVTKDAITGEVVLEGGALVLSDRGVCCIDELDKMSDVDRVSIHEVMEQQRVSIAKAGINCTLNARCGILAAANPVSGRYNPRRSVEQNVGLPCSLLSRFDVLCVLKDDANADDDIGMANHITNMHVGGAADADVNDENESNRMKGGPPATGRPNTPATVDYQYLSSFIEYVKTMNPAIPNSDNSLFISSYLRARRENTSTTPRMLLALIRLSLAHARLHGRSIVSSVDVEEARNLLEIMRVPVVKPTSSSASPKQVIYNAVVSMAVNRVVNVNELYGRVEYSRQVVDDVISDFANSGIWMREGENLMIFN